MVMSVVRMQTPEEQEYDRYLRQIEERKQRASELQVELETLKIALGRFEAEYHARVGTLFVELDRVRLAIDEYERRIERLTAQPDADPSEVEREINDEFASRREEVRTEDEETRRYEQAHREEQTRPRLDATSEDEAKRLYRELAKRFHPDLARTEEERSQRDRTMQRINAAFRHRDLNALRSIMLEEEIADPAFDARSIGEKLVWAIREVARLDEVISGLVADLDRCRESETRRLWVRQEQGEQVVERLEADLAAQLAVERDRLAALIGTYRHLVEHRHD